MLPTLRMAVIAVANVTEVFAGAVVAFRRRHPELGLSAPRGSTAHSPEDRPLVRSGSGIDHT
jgi:hypothetical protein